MLGGWAAPHPSPSHGAWQIVSPWPSVSFCCLAPPGGAGWQIWVVCLCPPLGHKVLFLAQMPSFLPPHAGGRGTSRSEAWTEIQEAESIPRTRGRGTCGAASVSPSGEGRSLDHLLEEVTGNAGEWSWTTWGGGLNTDSWAPPPEPLSLIGYIWYLAREFAF